MATRLLISIPVMVVVTLVCHGCEDDPPEKSVDGPTCHKIREDDTCIEDRSTCMIQDYKWKDGGCHDAGYEFCIAMKYDIQHFVKDENACKEEQAKGDIFRTCKYPPTLKSCPGTI